MRYDRSVHRLVILFALACSSSSSPRPAQPTPPAPLPAEVTTLVERWTNCWHFAGEEPYDDARKQELAREEARWCPGNEAERDRLRVKWHGDPAVQDALRKLDDMR